MQCSASVLTRTWSLAVLACAPAQLATAQILERVSVSSSGAQADGNCHSPALSQDGRYVAFWSQATNLVANDQNGSIADVFVRDRVAGTTELVSLGNAGQQPAATVFTRKPRISSDGRYVLFLSNWLDPLDTDANDDVYLRDRINGTTLWISSTNDNRGHWSFDLSGDGTLVVFDYADWASGAIPPSIEIRNHVSGQVWTLAGSNGTPTTPSHDYYDCVITRDGTSVVYYHASSDPVLGSQTRIERFVLATATTQVLLEPADYTTPIDTSSDGRYVLFTEYGLSFTSGFTSVHRLDSVTLARERMDERSIPLMYPPGGSGVWDAALSDSGAYAAFTSDDDHILPGDTNWLRECYLRIPAQYASLRPGLGLAGQEPDDASERVDITGDGSLVAFDSFATNLVLNDTNGASDVFVRSVCGDTYPDADGDGYGDRTAAGQLLCVPVPAGALFNALDCDDADPAVHPGVQEICDGVDQDCDGLIDEWSAGVGYCTTSVTSAGCFPTLYASGCPSATASSGLDLIVHIEGQKSGMFVYGLTTAAIPWAPGSTSTLCVGAPRQRTTLLQSNGTSGACNGYFSLDISAWLAAHPGALGMPLASGQTLYFQGWFRDPPAPSGTNLSNGLATTFGP